MARIIRNVGMAMSGGVDSSVAALLLKQKGYNVVGFYMNNWDAQEENSQYCNVNNDFNDVKWVCQHIGIQYKQVNLIRHYWNEVFSYFIDGTNNGVTPNPDIMCNQRIKFGIFHSLIINKYRMDAIATGHYAQLSTNEQGVRLMKSADHFKDQTYFLSTVSQSSLLNTLFPIGHLTKKEVKEIAIENGLHRIAKKKESMGLCFIGKRNNSNFMREYIDGEEGLMINILTGEIMGKHNGHQYYTIGQRSGLGDGNGPLFVINKDINNNTLFIGPSHLLYSREIVTSKPYWIRNITSKVLQARIRHQGELVQCRIEDYEYGLRVFLSQPIRAVTPGQYIVFYSGEECLGGACIKNGVMAESANDSHSTVNEEKQHVFVMRHGERLDSVDSTWLLNNRDRPYDTPLTGKGKVEAHQLSLKRYSDKNIVHVVSSPFTRCLQTAQEVCRATGVTGIVTRNILSEIMTRGANMIKTPSVPSESNISNYDINVIEFDTKPLPKYPETIDESIARYKAAIQEIADEYYPNNVVLVTHQYGVETSMLLDTGGNNAVYEASYCGNVELIREGRDGEWKYASKDRVYKYDNVF
ncbi:PREDICTED: uncharacterized protein LOC100637194 isoform X1 [Amphimedon queenslandica]|uniref:tRNA-5-taurinomethyluridine 2-sulfurtransferase n=1 Tax=Amphimedon queenslandica TaxID=400682 RepID=A0AAN0JE38_AMPQE|nr:PREDICTED: uncharacterized protein LOC100637194 isoform X1 [Amphimedon queenslandica]|eukprot:XP_019855017.1 PREDICTED: uncharacterized protein LOC100637194 isoform X1 [Amphimedon queenslandica]